MTGAALLAWAVKATAGPAWTHRAALIAGVLALVAGVLGALWDERLDVDLRDGRYRRRRGLWPFCRISEANLRDFPRLVLSHRRTIDPYGTPSESYSLAFEESRRKAILFRGYEDPSGRDIAYRIGARMDKTVEERSFSPDEPDDLELKTRRATTGALWTGFAGVVVVMFWPIISGARPLWRYSGSRQQDRAQVYSAAMTEHFNNGWDLYRRGRPAEAAVQFRLAVEREPRAADSWNMLAYALSAQNKMDEALEAAKRALNAAPGSGIVLDTVGEMYQLRGEYHQAADYYKRALAVLPSIEATETHCKYGMTLLALGHRSEAKSHLEIAARNDFSPYGRKAINALEEHFPRSVNSSAPVGSNLGGR